MLQFLLDSLFSMFVPSQDFLLWWQQDISDRFNDRMGNIIGAFSYMNSRFSMLREYRDIPGIFEIAFPPGSILHGVRMNILAPARDFVSWIRFVLTGMTVISTAFLVYGKVRRAISK